MGDCRIVFLSLKLLLMKANEVFSNQKKEVAVKDT